MHHDEELRPRGRPWSVRSVRRVHDNPWYAVDDYDAVAPTGSPGRYFLQVYKNLAIGILPLHEDGTVTLVGQWRFPFGAYSWELPEGGSPLGEDPLEGAKRELREEVGLEASGWRLILRMHLSNSTSDEVAIGYLATGFSPAQTEPDHTEDLAVIRPPFRRALDLALRGEIQDSITVAMLLRLYHMAREGELAEALSKAVLG